MGAWTGEPRQDRADARDLIPEPLIRAALIEDLSGRGDITTLTVIAPGIVTSAAIRATAAGHREQHPSWPFA